MFFFETSTLMPLAQTKRGEFKRGAPFPSLVLDGLLPAEVAQSAAEAFPSHSDVFFEPDNRFQEKKGVLKMTEGLTDVPPVLRHLINEFNSLAFLDFLGALTGIEGLIPDPHLRGGGVHRVLPGGKLAIHADFNVDRHRRLKRRLNVILYLNPEWREEYGGHLELWSADMAKCVQKISPRLNRCVIFETSETSFHGHPDPLACPAGLSRNSLAFFYYTALSDGDELDAATTRWKGRPGYAEPDGEGTRAYRYHFWETIHRKLKRQSKEWLPPPLTRAIGNWLAHRNKARPWD